MSEALKAAAEIGAAKVSSLTKMKRTPPMAKSWIIPKPEWEPFLPNADILQFGKVSVLVGIVNKQWQVEGFHEIKRGFATQSEARAYAEQRVMEALGAREME